MGWFGFGSKNDLTIEEQFDKVIEDANEQIQNIDDAREETALLLASIPDLNNGRSEQYKQCLIDDFNELVKVTLTEISRLRKVRDELFYQLPLDAYETLDDIEMLDDDRYILTIEE